MQVSPSIHASHRGGIHNVVINPYNPIVLLITILISASILLTNTVFAQDKIPVKIGFIFQENAANGQDAKAVLQGFEFFQKSETKGQVKFELLKRDSGANDEKTLESLADFIAKDVHIIVAPPSLQTSEYIIHGISAGKALLFITQPSVRLVGGELCLPTSFRLCPNSYQLGFPLAPWSVENISGSAYITGNDDTVANEAADFFAFGFERSGGHFSDRMMISSSNPLKNVIDGIRKSDAKIVFIASDKATTKNFIKEFRSAGLNQTLLLSGVSDVDVKSVQAPDKFLKDVFVLSAHKRLSEFTSAFKQKMKKDTTNLEKILEGYELGLILSQVITEKSFDPQKIADAIQTIELTGPRGKISFDKNHERIFDMFIQKYDKENGPLNLFPVKDLGPVNSPDFGCGRTGFPKKMEPDVKDEEPFWDERE